MMSFVVKTPATKPPTAADGPASSHDAAAPPAVESAFDQRFPPFFVKPNVTVAPVVRMARRTVEDLDASLGT